MQKSWGGWADFGGAGWWWGGVLMRIKTGRFGEVRWGLRWQIWGAEAYLGQRALRHKQLGPPFLVYASRRGGLPPSRLADLPEPAQLCGSWIEGEAVGDTHHQLEGEGIVKILGAVGGDREGKGPEEGVKTLALSTHPHTRTHRPFWVGEWGRN